MMYLNKLSHILLYTYVGKTVTTVAQTETMLPSVVGHSSSVSCVNIIIT